MKRIPDISITIILALLLATMLSFVMPKNKEKYLGKIFWTKKTFAPSKFNVVLMGDSRVYRGLSPEVMKKELPGMKILNFGFSDGSLNEIMCRATEKKLARDEQLKVIVLGISPNTITGYTQSNKQYLQELTRPKEEIFESLYLNPLLYWFSSTTPQKLIKKTNSKKPTSYYNSKYNMNGYVESEKFPVDTIEAISLYIKDFTNYKVEEKYMKQLFIQVNKWAKKGIIVIGYRPPVSQPMVELENTLGRYNKKAIQHGIENAGGHWLELNSANFQTYDGSHLDKQSAIKLSEKIALEIQKLAIK